MWTEVTVVAIGITFLIGIYAGRVDVSHAIFYVVLACYHFGFMLLYYGLVESNANDATFYYSSSSMALDQFPVSTFLILFPSGVF